MRQGQRSSRPAWRARRPRRAWVSLLGAAALLVSSLSVLGALASPTQAATVPASISVVPTTGRVNTIVTITLMGLWPGWVDPTTGIENQCVMSWLFDGAAWTLTGTGGTGQGGLPGHTATGSIPLTAAVGAHTIQAVCTNPLTGGATARPTTPFTVTPTSWALGASPSSTTAGTAVGVSLTSFNNAHANPNCNVTYQLDGTGPKKGNSSNAAGTPTPLTYTVPTSLSVGAHTFKVTCGAAGLAGTATATFTVNPAPTTTTTRGTTTTKPGSPTTTRPGSPTTTKPGATTSTGGSTTSTGSSGSSSTSASIDTTPTTVPGQAPVTANTYLKLTALAIAPGAQVSANGKGCDADAPVALTIGSRPVGHTHATDSGAFHTPLSLGPLSVGRYTVVAHCGVILAAPLDIVLASQVSAATSTLAIIIFVLLIGALAFRRQIFPRRPVPARVAAEPDLAELTDPPGTEPPT